MIVSYVLFAMIIALMIFISKIDKQSNATTTVYVATVSDVKVVDNGKNVFAEIYINEYSNHLYVSTNVAKRIDLDSIRDLNGQIIFFGIENTKVPQMNEVDFVDIVSLKTETKEIFSLEKYNECINKATQPARITALLFASLFFCIALFNLIKIIKIINKKRLFFTINAFVFYLLSICTSS